MDITDKYILASYIRNEIENEFILTFGKSLIVNSLNIDIDENGEISLNMDLPDYDRKLFNQQGIFIPKTNAINIANNIDEYSTKHKNFFEKCVEKGIEKYMIERGKMYESRNI